MTEEVEKLSPEQTNRAIAEVVEAAGDAGISEDNLRAAVTAPEDLVVSAALWRNWADGQLAIGWDAEIKKLQWRTKE
jgi:hypothetical protein